MQGTRILAETNAAWLRQARELLDRIDDRTYADEAPGVAPHRAGGHFRHILEFYECFLDGLSSGLVDYDARKRDLRLETSRRAAIDTIGWIIRALETSALVHRDGSVLVHMEDSRDVADALLESSVGRELQVLSSHTIHHFALIALTLRAWGIDVDERFGVAPSTLRNRESAARTAEAA